MTEEKETNTVDAGKQTDNGAGAVDGGNADKKQEQSDILSPEIKKMIQSETDRVRNQYSTQIKELKSQLDSIQKEKMTDEEKAKFEQEQLSNRLKEKEAELSAKEIRLKVIETLTKKGMPLEMVDVAMGKDEDDTNKRIAILEATLQKQAEKVVEQKFKELGRDVPTGNNEEPNWDEMSMAEYEKLRSKK